MRESAIRCPWDGEPTVAWHLIAVSVTCPPYCPRRWHLHIAASCDHTYSVDMDGQMYIPMTGAPPRTGGER